MTQITAQRLFQINGELHAENVLLKEQLAQREAQAARLLELLREHAPQAVPGAQKSEEKPNRAARRAKG